MAGKSGFDIEEKEKALPDSDQEESDGDCVSGMDDEMDLGKLEAEKA